MTPTYNHTREDSPLTPCPACAKPRAEVGALLINFLLDLHAAGVRRYRGETPDGCRVDVEFFPRVHSEPAAAGPVVPLDLGETPRCPCTHEREAEHAPNGLCYFGCPVTLCNPTLTAKPESAPMSG